MGVGRPRKIGTEREVVMRIGEGASPGGVMVMTLPGMTVPVLTEEEGGLPPIAGEAPPVS